MPRPRGHATAALAFVIAASFALSPGCAPPRFTTLETGRALFLENRIDPAIDALEVAVRERPRDADAHAWLAEALRRKGDHERADAEARAALAIDPHHAFAHEVIGWNANPMFGLWKRADPDTAWTHVQAAIACDSSAAGAWTAAWIHALEHGDDPLASQALRRLVDTGFLTSAVLAHGRWLLRGLPERAVLLVNGDMDTYPTCALQVVEAFRPDVAIVNQSLLNTVWYRRHVRDRLGVAMPFGPAALDSLAPRRDAGGPVDLASSQLVRGWLAMEAEGRLGRPFAIACTVPDLDFTPDTRERLVMSGAGYQVEPRPVATRIDTTRVRASLLALSPAQFAPPWTSPLDRSPIRRETAPLLGLNVMAAAFQYVAASSAAGRERQADAMRGWARWFAREARFDSAQVAMVDRMMSPGATARRP